MGRESYNTLPQLLLPGITPGPRRLRRLLGFDEQDFLHDLILGKLTAEDYTYWIEGDEGREFAGYWEEAESLLEKGLIVWMIDPNRGEDELGKRDGFVYCGGPVSEFFNYYMTKGPVDGLRVERLDPNAHYEPGPFDGLSLAAVAF